MSNYLNLYKIFNKERNTLSDFIDHEALNDFLLHLQYEGKSIDDYEIYCLNMQNITKCIDTNSLPCELGRIVV